jgi:DNA-binding NarL/FixJ family response regulator
MVTTSVGIDDQAAALTPPSENAHVVRIILADTQAIFRAGLRKIFALEDDLRVVGQAETLVQTLSTAKKFTADILLFEAELSPDPGSAVGELIKQNPELHVVVITAEPNEELTLDLFRRGAHAIVSREVEPEMLVDCLRKVAKGELWLDSRGIHWVLAAYRSQSVRGAGPRPKVHLTPKESVIVSCVTQGMKNKEIAHHVGTTEQVVKNYLRKVYDKLNVADRLELALYCLNNRVVEGQTTLAPAAPAPAEPTPVNGSDAATTPIAASAAAGQGDRNQLS